VLGALVFRALLIGAGIFLLARFHWVIYVFAILVLVAAARMIWGGEAERTVVAKACDVCGSWVARFIPVTPVLSGDRFWIRRNGRYVATPLLLGLLVVETTDVVFALDSIPAVLAITNQPFLVYTSNAFAVLGLRSLYFVLAGALDRLRYLRPALAAILVFVGARMLLDSVLEIPVWMSLGVIAGVLAVAIVISLWKDT
jgi:tellurite resistance protein TerC